MAAKAFYKKKLRNSKASEPEFWQSTCNDDKEEDDDDDDDNSKQLYCKRSRASEHMELPAFHFGDAQGY